MGIYDELAVAATQMLASSLRGGLGQDGIYLIRRVTAPGANAWDEPTVIETRELLLAVAQSGLGYSDANIEASREAILATDTIVTAIPPGMEWRTQAPGELAVLISGREIAVIQVDAVPPVAPHIVLKIVAREG